MFIWLCWYGCSMTDSLAFLRPRYRIGLSVNWKGQRYELTGFKPHTCRDGRETQLLIWQSTCPTCGAPFETTTPCRRLKDPNRRCARHHRPGRRV
jgi:hypothetical protein